MRKVIGTLGAAAFVFALTVAVTVAVTVAPAAGAKTAPTVGSRITIANGTLRLHAYEQPVSADGTGKDPADAGKEYAAADVEACSTASKKQQVTPFMFSLVLPDGTKALATVTVKQPSMSSALLTKGTCTRGWVTFEVPQGTRAKQLAFGTPTSTTANTTAKWKVPAA